MYSTQTVALSKGIQYTEDKKDIYEIYKSLLESAKELYNQALFYERNVFTGCNKLKEGKDLFDNEKEAISYVNDNLFLCLNKSGEEVYQRVDENHRSISYNHLQKLLYKTNNEAYFNNDLPPQTRNKIIDLACKNMKSFFTSIKEYVKSPEKFKGKPKLPGYKKPYQWQTMEIPNGTGKIEEKDNKYYFRVYNYSLYLGNTIHNGRLIKTSVSLEYGKIVFRFVFEEKDIFLKEDNKRYLGIDLGVNDFATISNNIGLRPVVIKGKIFKAKNQYYNMRKAKLQSCLDKFNNATSNNIRITNQMERLSRYRSNYFRDVFHKISKGIVNYALENNISKIIVGENKGWKQEVDLDKFSKDKTQNDTQNFVSIPYNQFKDILKDKASRYGIEVVFVEESYTSKSSILDLDILPTYSKNKDEDIEYQFKGYRKQRSVYKSYTFGALHADVNGASNIIRKYNFNAFDSKDLGYLKQFPIGLLSKF